MGEEWRRWRGGGVAAAVAWRRRGVAWRRRGVAWRGVAWRGVAWRGVAWLERTPAWRSLSIHQLSTPLPSIPSAHSTPPSQVG